MKTFLFLSLLAASFNVSFTAKADSESYPAPVNGPGYPLPSDPNPARLTCRPGFELVYDRGYRRYVCAIRGGVHGGRG